MQSKHEHELARQIQRECIEKAVSAYESASISGLCGEGAFEAAVSAMRMIDVTKVLESRQRAADGPEQ